jgi:hypothetical protein
LGGLRRQWRCFATCWRRRRGGFHLLACLKQLLRRAGDISPVGFFIGASPREPAPPHDFFNACSAALSRQTTGGAGAMSIDGISHLSPMVHDFADVGRQRRVGLHKRSQKLLVGPGADR